ncbi:hypothetical protein [uncultured Paraglaciecola sp.]|uniref:hypothetical protein n=1 Tax=uncultured Paraglaciecola sp. TaxID=1765024 RepID=UPI0026241597|nr:hypothetical protein [uncultured Paraglaciecola sp.]
MLDDTPKKPRTMQDLPPIPDRCTGSQCFERPRKTSLVLMEVEDEHYQKQIVPASRAMPQDNGSARRQLRFGIDFVQWHSRCVECAYSDPMDVKRTWSGQ